MNARIRKLHLRKSTVQNLSPNQAALANGGGSWPRRCHLEPSAELTCVNTDCVCDSIYQCYQTQGTCYNSCDEPCV